MNYRTKTIASLGVESRAQRNLPKIGMILSIVGKRFTSTRKSSATTTSTTSHEVVVITGSRGKATFSGVLWGYSGQGPRALVKLLVLCGVSQDIAEQIAFNTPRNTFDGIDWEYFLDSQELHKYSRTVTQLPQNVVKSLS